MERQNKKPFLQKGYLIIIAAVAGVVLLIAPMFFENNENKGVVEERTDDIYYSEKLEKKLSELICASQGVGKASVVVTLDGTGEYVYAKNENTTNSGYSTDYVILNQKEGEDGVLISEIYPKVRGVAVVCTGGNDPQVKKKITELICAALGIAASKIAVYG